MYAALPSTMTATLDTEEHLSLLTWQDAGFRRAATTSNSSGNVTDVDDKIIKRAAERKILPSELAETYTKRMQEDLEELGCLPPSVEPRATQYIPKMLALIEKLEEKGYAYQDKNGRRRFLRSKI